LYFYFWRNPKRKKKQTSYCNIKTRSLRGEIEHNIIAFPKNEKYEKNQEICISILIESNRQERKKEHFFLFGGTRTCAGNILP
jgi:hypothetical protein